MQPRVLGNAVFSTAGAFRPRKTKKKNKRARLIPNKKCTKAQFVLCCSPCVRLRELFYGSRWKCDLIKTSQYTVCFLTSAYEKAHGKIQQKISFC